MEEPKKESVVVIYRDGKPEEVPVSKFLKMLEELKRNGGKVNYDGIKELYAKEIDVK